MVWMLGVLVATQIVGGWLLWRHVLKPLRRDVDAIRQSVYPVLGSQMIAGIGRLEAGAGVVAADLAAAQDRADATPDGTPGEAADAAMRRGSPDRES